MQQERPHGTDVVVLRGLEVRGPARVLRDIVADAVVLVEYRGTAGNPVVGHCNEVEQQLDRVGQTGALLERQGLAVCVQRHDSGTQPFAETLHEAADRAQRAIVRRA